MKKYLAAALLVSALSAAAFVSAEAREAGPAPGLKFREVPKPPAGTQTPAPANPAADAKKHDNNGNGNGHVFGTWRCMQVGKNQWVANCLGPADEALPHSHCPGQPPAPCKRNNHP